MSSFFDFSLHATQGKSLPYQCTPDLAHLCDGTDDLFDESFSANPEEMSPLSLLLSTFLPEPLAFATPEPVSAFDDDGYRIHVIAPTPPSQPLSPTIKYVLPQYDGDVKTSSPHQHVGIAQSASTSVLRPVVASSPSLPLGQGSPPSVCQNLVWQPVYTPSLPPPPLSRSPSPESSTAPHCHRSEKDVPYFVQAANRPIMFVSPQRPLTVSAQLSEQPDAVKARKRQCGDEDPEHRNPRKIQKLEHSLAGHELAPAPASGSSRPRKRAHNDEGSKEPLHKKNKLEQLGLPISVPVTPSVRAAVAKESKSGDISHLPHISLSTHPGNSQHRPVSLSFYHNEHTFYDMAAPDADPPSAPISTSCPPLCSSSSLHPNAIETDWRQQRPLALAPTFQIPSMSSFTPSSYLATFPTIIESPINPGSSSAVTTVAPWIENIYKYTDAGLPYKLDGTAGSDDGRDFSSEHFQDNACAQAAELSWLDDFYRQIAYSDFAILF